MPVERDGQRAEHAVQLDTEMPRGIPRRVSWGRFFFASTMELVPDKKLHLLDGQHGRHTSIGANCEAYGDVDVEVRDAAGAVLQTVRVINDTFTWVTGLTPDTDAARARGVGDHAIRVFG
jgi:hypothetical protein